MDCRPGWECGAPKCCVELSIFDVEAVRVKIPADCMAIQVGECTQVVTGGEFVATPHCVRGCRPQYTQGRKVARVACPCFVDTHPTFELRTL